MIHYKKFEVDEKTYNRIVQTQFENCADIKEHKIGSRKNLYLDNKLIASFCRSANLNIGKISPQMFKTFLANFNKQLYSQYLKNEDLFYLNVKQENPAKSKNRQNWNNISDGEYLYSIDISSAYWQIAHLLGYLNKNMFDKYIHIDEFKEVKRYCISFLARQNKTRYYKGSDNVEIQCDTTILTKTYENIRNKLYNIMYECSNAVSQNEVEYNIDAIVVRKEDIPKVKAVLLKYNLLFKITERKKINCKQYTAKGKVKNFTK